MVTRIEQRHAFYDDAIENVRIIMVKSEALEFLEELGDAVVALDFETTGLDPRYSHVRLSCIYHPDCGAVLLDHMFCGSFAELSEHMLAPMWAVYNAKFEVQWFDKFFPDAVDLIDVDFLAKVKRGGGHSSLAMITKRDLHIDLDKSAQLSDWTLERLTTTQINYAAMDAVVTWKLYEYWSKQLTQGQKAATAVLQDAVRATVECEQTGMVLDIAPHEYNIALWKKRQTTALRSVRKLTNAAMLPNVNSNKQISDLLKKQLPKEVIASWPKTEKTHQLSLDRKTLSPIAAKATYPFSRWLNALILFRYYSKYLSTYGETLLTKQFLEDKITYRLNIAAAATCRYSSSSINIQNIPRKITVRRAFLPPVQYDKLVVADYSGVEVRTLAELSGDKLLLRDTIYGNVHASSAAQIYDIPEDEFLETIDESRYKDGEERPREYYVFKEMRSTAKGFTFQLTYGAAAPALSVVLKCTVEEAELAIKKWADKYSRAYNYRFTTFDAMSRNGYIPVCDGRTIFVRKADRTMPIAANYGIQAAAASVMLRAMHHTYELRNMMANRSLIGVVATVHDELLLGAKEAEIGMAKTILTEGMKRGWLDIFPNTDTHNLIEAKVGSNWGEAK